MRNRKKIFHLIVTLAFFGSGIVSCATQQQSDKTEAPTLSISPRATGAEASRAPSDQPTPGINYQILSPSKIQKDGATYEASATITQSRFNFRMDGKGALPPDFPPENADQNLVSDVKFITAAPGPNLELEFYGGGGGGGAIEGQLNAHQGFDYRVKTALTKGQNIHLTAIVTFAEYTGITTPVSFELDLVVE